mmetsp:Transcript_51039/g.153414  ORF Transcript_51039/g.153414 Transcript_51039/m.153414 type:complete len:217 (-) Transcript_51039:422-1072(-)
MEDCTPKGKSPGGDQVQKGGFDSLYDNGGDDLAAAMGGEEKVMADKYQSFLRTTQGEGDATIAHVYDLFSRFNSQSKYSTSLATTTLMQLICTAFNITRRSSPRRSPRIEWPNLRCSTISCWPPTARLTPRQEPLVRWTRPTPSLALASTPSTIPTYVTSRTPTRGLRETLPCTARRWEEDSAALSWIYVMDLSQTAILRCNSERPRTRAVAGSAS